MVGIRGPLSKGDSTAQSEPTRLGVQDPSLDVVGVLSELRIWRINGFSAGAIHPYTNREIRRICWISRSGRVFCRQNFQSRSLRSMERYVEAGHWRETQPSVFCGSVCVRVERKTKQ